MEITKLINVFEKLLPIYQEAYDKDYSLDELQSKNLNDGLCYASVMLAGTSISTMAYDYYRNYLNFTYEVWGAKYLFPLPKTGKDLKPRIDFMKSEIKSLKRLIKKRIYTRLIYGNHGQITTNETRDKSNGHYQRILRFGKLSIGY